MQPNWLNWTKRLQAIAQAGLTYAQDPFDRERYGQIRQIAVEIAAAHTGQSAALIHDLFAQQEGYPTPKVDVRAALFQDDAILLVRERVDGCWTLPGGWADVGESPSQAVVREVREEAGYDCRAVKVAAVYDRDHPRHGHPYFPFQAYKLHFLCELLGGQPSGGGIETTGVDFFPQSALPPLSVDRVTISQIDRLFEHHANPDLPTDFD